MEDASEDMLGPQLEDLLVNVAAENLVINGGIGQIELRLAERDGSVLMAELKDEGVNVVGRHYPEISRAMEGGQIVVPAPPFVIVTID